MDHIVQPVIEKTSDKSTYIIRKVIDLCKLERGHDFHKPVKTIDKGKYVANIRTLKEALNHGSVMNKVCIVIKFYQQDWLKLDIHMNTKASKKSKNWFQKIFKLKNNPPFGKTMENIRNQRVETCNKWKKQLINNRAQLLSLKILVKY